MTSLAFSFAHAIARQRAREGSSILISELEHFGNVDPVGAELRRSRRRRGLPPSRPRHLPARGRRHGQGVLQPAGGSGGRHTRRQRHRHRPGRGDDRAQAHEAGALVAVDGVHAVPHLQVDLEALAPDIFFCSAYKFYGPHLGIALVREELAEELQPYKVTPAPESGPEKFETGSQNHEAIAGLAGTLDALASLVGGAGGDGAREALGELSRSQASIAEWIEGQLRAMPKVRLYPGEERRRRAGTDHCVPCRGPDAG